ncbi:MAG: ATP cone domain-containing protein, partial [Thermoproteota archaeon]|nr:ATP cone domain-containing protein [Thermoproteota archaeon]
MAETDLHNSKNESILHIKKRNGAIVNFEQSKISNAIYKALAATGKPDHNLAEVLATKLFNKIVKSGYVV